MKLIRSIMGLLALACLSLAPAAQAAVVVTGPGLTYAPNVYLQGINAATAAYTNATTSYTDVAGTEVTVPITYRDYSKQYLRVCYSADVIKATTTTGTIQVYANAAGIAASRRTVDVAAKQNTISGCYTVARSSAAAQTVKLQAVSGDTATFTINNAQIEVWIIVLN